jgi:dTDP-4-amino-4,6-dideoxygalactose transaminase
MDRGNRQTTRRDFLVFGRPVIEEAEIQEVVDSLRSGWIGTGPKVDRFEKMLQEYVGAPYVRCLSSCTSGLILGMRALGIGPGDEVIVPSMTFAASANSVEHDGADCVLVDSEPGTGLIDFDAAEAAVTPRTRAIMPVHLAGRPVDLGRLDAFAKKHDIHVISDAAHALGAEWHGRRVGMDGEFTAFSFYATKNITTIEGGAMATGDEELAERVRRQAQHGLSRSTWKRFGDSDLGGYEVSEPGLKANMTDVQAALGMHQLPRLDRWIDARAEAWERYDELLADLPLETPPPEEPGTRHARHLYQVLVEPGPHAAERRDEMIHTLAAQRIGAGVHYRAVHLHRFYQEKYRLAPESLPVAHDISMRTLSLPLGPTLTEADQVDVANAVREALRAQGAV